MKISYVTSYDAENIHNWSGLGFNIAQALKQQGNNLDFIGNLESRANAIIRLKSMCYNRIIKRPFHIEREPYIAQQYAKQILSRLKKDTDILFSPGTIPISLLESNKLKVFYTDATFAGMIGFYDSFSNLSKETIRHGNYLEQAALDSANLAIYSSDWAAQTAIKYYNVNPEKIKVVPFGANLDSIKTYREVQSIISTRSLTECHLLFLGVDWKRKGGDMALRIADKLNSLGIKTILHIAGIKDFPYKKVPQYVINHGFISKSTQAGKDKIESLLSMCHFLILPTKADCTPVVYSEANSFGLPCISTNVGGISTIIKDELNGKTFSLYDTENTYSEYISSIFCDKTRYNDLCCSSFNEFETRLNWSVAGKSITNLLHQL